MARKTSSKRDPLSVGGLEKALLQEDSSLEGIVVPNSGVRRGLRAAVVSITAQKELSRRIAAAEARVLAAEEDSESRWAEDHYSGA